MEIQTRGWAAIRSGRHTLISAPTGSGKTLAAFLSALDDLLEEGLANGGELPDETRIVYVSPLKALSADIHRNLAEPRREIRQTAERMGLPAVRITAATRSGDTTQSERRAMLRTPPHILVTTPESLYLLLTAERSREILRTARAVIVDEIHAVLDSRRGSHLSLTLERLEHVAGRAIQRIGLSATQKPIEEVARFLVSAGGLDPEGRPRCEIVNAGHLRALDLGLELPGSPLEAVMSGEMWEEAFERLVTLIEAHRTTLVFVNTRRLAERVARSLSERLGEAAVTAHHGSLSKETRLDAERRLKAGELRALVATASLELGIDIGFVDLVCQIGSPHRIAAFLQRIGRSGHTVRGTPKGRLFPLTRDDLVECAALLRAVRAGELDRLRILPRPLDVLAQQIVAEAACEPWREEDLFNLVRRAYPYRKLTREEFDEVVRMVARGFATRRGRRGALIHHDAVNGRLRGRKGARLVAITSGGAIPDNADYRVVLEPEGSFLGTLNEDFASESMAGDIFQLGNASWRILQVSAGVVRVADAQGLPPSIPFWLGEAPGRSRELSAAVSELRGEVDERLKGDDAPEAMEPDSEAAGQASAAQRATEWLVREVGLPPVAAAQIATYFAESKRILGVLPTHGTLVLERFFDESGGMQLVLHAPFGSRINRAWGLALRKRFCQSFNFELQAAATEEGILLSLGPQHSFPLAEVFRYLHPDTVRDLLVQAVFDAPVFQTRWRWNASVSLAVPRWRRGRKTPPQIQRMEAEDLLSAVFPDATACLEHIVGAREIPDHPLVRQTIEDCVEEAMDFPRLREILRAIWTGELRCVARDTPEPSPLSHEILNARPYAFLDGAPLEERRAQAVYARRALEPSSAVDLGALDPQAIDRVREEAWPDPETPDELHDALLTGAFLLQAEGERFGWTGLLDELTAAGRATLVQRRQRGHAADGAEPSSQPASLPGALPSPAGSGPLWVAAERLPEIRSVFPEAEFEPAVTPPPGHSLQPTNRDEAIRELLRSRLEMVGPTTAAVLGASLGVSEVEAEQVLLALETEGVVLRGTFTPAAGGLEWCDRRLLSRIHRYTLNRLRAEIEPVSAADFMRFLFQWQCVEPEHRVKGDEGLAAVIEQLDGLELPAAAWETEVLAARCEEYEPELLDRLCLGGRMAWGRLTPPAGEGTGLAATGPLRSSPIGLFRREHGAVWLSPTAASADEKLSSPARIVLERLRRRGASFFAELVAGSALLPTQVEQALGELVALGYVTSDSFAGLRALLTPSEKRKPLLGEAEGTRRRRRTAAYGVDTAGRWSLLRPVDPVEQAAHPAEKAAHPPEEAPTADREEATRQATGNGPSDRARAGEGLRGPLDAEPHARALLRRYGVVFRRLLDRETRAPSWRELVLVYRRLEARGEMRGRRFVRGFSGEHFALPEAVGKLRTVRRAEPTGRLLVLSAADPLNLTGIITPGERIPALTRNRIGYRDGVPLYVREGNVTRSLEGKAPADPETERALARRRVPPSLRAYAARR
ncbi:MAG: DEAD/DEAH box helicase [Gemmatimonadota bacterium]